MKEKSNEQEVEICRQAAVPELKSQALEQVPGRGIFASLNNAAKKKGPHLCGHYLLTGSSLTLISFLSSK